MVNETNKPSIPEYEHLNERLSASTRHLQEMQEEHHNLLQEMETLRQRATMLTRLDESYHMTTTSSSSGNEEPITTSETVRTSSSSSQASVDAAAIGKCGNTKSQDNMKSDANITQSSATSHEESSMKIPQASMSASIEDDDEEDPEEADFIRKKLEEIAGLKAQLKRVQHMTNTTKLIEEHISSHATSSMSSSSVQEEILNQESLFSSIQNRASEISSSSSSSSTMSAARSTRNGSTNDNNSIADTKAELLSTMTNMFTDYASDLRGQADNLRAERERIRALKEKILESKRPF